MSMVRKRKNPFSVGLTQNIAGLAIGARVVEGIGGPLAESGGSAFQQTGRMLPALGSVGGFKMVQKNLNTLTPKRRRFRL